MIGILRIAHKLLPQDLPVTVVPSLLVRQRPRLQDTVALYVALGGGWWNAPPAERG